MISTAIVLYLILAIINSVRVGVVTTVALAKGKPPPVQRHPGDSVVGTIGRAMVRGFVDDLTERRTAGAELRTKKRAVRERRRTDRWESRQAKRRPARTDDLDDRIPDWARGRTDDTDDHEPDRPDRRRRDRPDPTPPGDRPDGDRPSDPPGDDGLFDFLFGDGPRTPVPEDDPPADPVAPPPDQPTTNPRPGRPHLVVVPPPADIPMGETMTVTTTTPTGEVVDPAHLVAFFDGVAKSPVALLPAIEAAIANLGKVGFSDGGVTGPIHQIQQALVLIRNQAAVGRAAAQRHVQHAAQTAATPGAAVDNRFYGARPGGPAPAGFTPSMPDQTATPAHGTEHVPTA